MGLERAASADIPEIYNLLETVRFHELPSYSRAVPILEGSHAYILRENGDVLLWAAYHGKTPVCLDLVISPTLSRFRITKGICKDILAAGFELSQNDCIAVEAYNPKGIRAALKMGFRLADLREEDGWVKLVLTREEFERKFVMRGKSL